MFTQPHNYSAEILDVYLRGKTASQPDPEDAESWIRSRSTRHFPEKADVRGFSDAVEYHACASRGQSVAARTQKTA